MVTCTFSAHLTSKGTGTGVVRLTLPFNVDQLTRPGGNPSDLGGGAAITNYQNMAMSTGTTGLYAYTDASVNTLIFQEGTTSATNAMTDAALTNSSRINGTIVYYTSQ